MSKLHKRALSMVVTLVMVLSMLPVTSFAEGTAETDTGNGQVIADTYVSSSNAAAKDTEYSGATTLKTKVGSYRTYFKVNIGQIPEGKKITKVELVLVDTSTVTTTQETGFTIKAYTPAEGVTDVAFSALTWNSVSDTEGTYTNLNWANGTSLENNVTVTDKTITITIDYDQIDNYIDESGNILFAFATRDKTLELSSLENETNNPQFKVYVVNDEDDTAVVPDPEIDVKYNLTLESFMDFSFFVAQEDLDKEGMTVTIQQAGKEAVTVTNWETKDGYWRFRYADVAPAEYEEEVTLVIKNADSEVVVEDTTTIKAYIELRISREQNDKAMMEALLAYCGAAKVYFTQN